MTTRDNLIEALRKLCESNGGYKAVADSAGVDDQSLYQILSGVKLPSGNPKGVGPTIQSKLDKAFPGWAEAGSTIVAKEERAVYNNWPFRQVKQAALRAVSDEQLAAIEEVLGAALEGMRHETTRSGDDWRSVARTLATSLDKELGKAVYSDFVLQVDKLFGKRKPSSRAKSAAN